MTRIIAGGLAGRRLQVPAGPTRPTTDRVREALFNWLDHRGCLPRARVADLYAGSGALGLEALSRGADSAVFVEQQRRAAAVIRRNAAALEVADRCEIVAMPVERWRPSPDRPFDVILLDPPYDLPPAAAMAALSRAPHGTGAYAVVEQSRRAEPPRWPRGWVPLDRREYGETVLWYGLGESPAPDDQEL